MSIEHKHTHTRTVNWRVNEFCKAHGLGRTKFYELVAAGKIELVKCGSTSLITNSAAQRFQAALEAGEI
jgi:excisionase family DNA binding protein